MNQSAYYHLKKLASFSSELCFSVFPHEISLPRWQHCGVPLLDWCIEENDPMQHPGLDKKSDFEIDNQKISNAKPTRTKMPECFHNIS